MTNRIERRAAVSLIATGLLFLVGVVLHPHAPNAHDMAEVAYTQTGQINWWPAHLLLLSSYVLFAVALFSMRLDGLPPQAPRVLKLTRQGAVLCVFAMLVHLLLPLGRDSVAASHHGWAFWAKDFVESLDGLWAVCVATVAWLLGRVCFTGYWFPASLGVVGGIGFALFSVLVPLTGVLVSMQVTRSLLHVVPVFAILIVIWTVATGLGPVRARASLDPPLADAP